jgi:D-alanyl-D-alanine carboxypeptidase
LRKKITAIVIALFHLGLYLCPPGLALASHSIPINAASAILMDNQTGKILYSKTPNIKLAPAIAYSI